MTLDDRVKRLPVRDQIFHWSMMLGVTVVIALLTWAGGQVVGMRDDVHTLKDQLPALTQRLDRVENRVDKLDDEARERGR